MTDERYEPITNFPPSVIENYYADFSDTTLNVPEEPKPLTPSEELQRTVAEALMVLERRSFSERHPELGKMVNCRVCSTRHRLNERKCEQVFTYRIGDYELYREDEQGELVPAYRTAMRPDEKPTKNQLHGAPKMVNFSMPRYHPHPSKIKLQFIERTRKIFEELDFELLDEKDEAFKRLVPTEQKVKQEQFQKDLQRARVLAARELRRERELSDREVRRRQDQSRRINQGLL